MYTFRLGARRQTGHLLRNGPASVKFGALFDTKSAPHGDTLEKLFRRIEPGQVQEVVSGMIETLIRNKMLYPYRLAGRWFVAAVDGTGVVSFEKRHCPFCLTRTRNGKTLYYHNVLEAKLVTENGFAFSLMSEFIENPGENPAKQNCELKAFYKFCERLKKRFKRLPILLTLDGLFAGGPTFELCRKNGWKFMTVLTDKDLKQVNNEFEALTGLQPENRLTFRTGKKAEIEQKYRWVDQISYLDSRKMEHTLNVIECLETKPDKDGKVQTTKFKWVTNYKVNSSNVFNLANQGGRDRWKVENEGFNVQKTGGYELEHAFSENETSAKIFYFLLQIAHTIFQLIEKGSLFKKAFGKGVGSAKNLAFRLLEAWRNARFSKEGFLERKQIQIRFDSS